MSDNWRQLTLYPLRWISLGGLHPLQTSKWAFLLFWCNFCCFGGIVVLAVIEIFISYSNNIYFTIESMLTIVLYLHIISKYSILSANKSTLGELLEEQKCFWKIENFDGEIHDNCEKTLKTAFTVIKSYLTYSLLVVTSFLLQPIITGQLPVFLYTPEGCYYVLFIIFFSITPGIMASIWGVDTIYYSVSMPVCIQFKLLANQFEKLNLKNSQEIEELKKCINYHNFLLAYCGKINKMSGGIFLTQFLVAIATSCMQLFIASQPEFGLMNKFKCLSYFTMQIIETAIYCFTAELISKSSKNVGNAIYKSNWYTISDNNVKKNIILVIAKSQNFVTFNGLGLVQINTETFTRIFKTALSFYTYLNTMVFKN